MGLTRDAISQLGRHIRNEPNRGLGGVLCIVIVTRDFALHHLSQGCDSSLYTMRGILFVKERAVS